MIWATTRYIEQACSTISKGSEGGGVRCFVLFSLYIFHFNLLYILATKWNNSQTASSTIWGVWVWVRACVCVFCKEMASGRVWTRTRTRCQKKTVNADADRTRWGSYGRGRGRVSIFRASVQPWPKMRNKTLKTWIMKRYLKLAFRLPMKMCQKK